MYTRARICNMDTSTYTQHEHKQTGTTLKQTYLNRDEFSNHTPFMMMSSKSALCDDDGDIVVVDSDSD